MTTPPRQSSRLRLARCIAACTLFCLSAMPAPAQQAPASMGQAAVPEATHAEDLGSAATPLLPPVLPVVWTQRAPLIDGRVEPGEWDLAPWSEPWSPLRADAPPDHIVARAMHDDLYLYLCVLGTAVPRLPLAAMQHDHFDEADPAHPAHQRPPGPPFEALDIFIDPRALGTEPRPMVPEVDPGHYQITVLIQPGVRRPRGEGPPFVYTATRAHARGGRSTSTRPGWFPPALAVACTSDECGYRLELAIPLLQFSRNFGMVAGHPHRPGETPLDVTAPPMPAQRYQVQLARRHANGSTYAWATQGSSPEWPIRPHPLARPFGVFEFQGNPAMVMRSRNSLAADLPEGWLQTSWREATLRATHERRPLLILYAPEAMPLDDLLAPLLRQPELRRAMARSVAVRLDVHQLPVGAPSHGFRRMPAMALLAPDGRTAGRWAGMPNAAQLIEAFRRTLPNPPIGPNPPLGSERP